MVLLPASFRGVPFAVTEDDTQFGRRVALHVYPGRDVPWAEDMGRAPRQFSLRGFIVADDLAYFGGPIAAQRLAITAAAELSDAGVLTHPSLGVLSVNCTRFSLGQDTAAGTMSAISFEFVESGKRSYPSLLTNGSGLFSATNVVAAAIAVDLARVVIAATSAGGNRADAAPVTAALSTAAIAAAADATSLVKLAALLPGNLGRYSAGGNRGYVGSNASTLNPATTIATLTTTAAAARAAVVTAATALATTVAAAGGTATDADVAAAMNAVAAALLAACADPADAIRLLSALLVAGVPGLSMMSAVGVATLAAFRRAFAGALAQASAAYQPASYDDAAALLLELAQLLDDQATAAADAGDDQSYAALSTLRAAVVADLRARGATLARVRSFALPGPLPALAVAQQIYRDPARSDELVGQADPRHPLFMPTTFTALAA